MKKNIKFSIFAIILLLFLAGCSNVVDHSSMNHSSTSGDEKANTVEEKDGKKIFSIEVKETHWMLNDELMFDAWTYNGTLPGQEIRVQEGDEVVLRVKNQLEVPTALHLHGFPVPNEMDGVPGVTQNAIMPGEEFVYEYTANVPGTYWYHSHQNGAEQVDRGLYGVFIVEPKDGEDYQVDEVIIIDEWSSMMSGMSGMDGMNHGSMGHGNMNGKGHGNNTEHMTHTEMMNIMYDTMLINGKATPSITPVTVKEGDKVKLRFLNAGLFTQVVSIPGHSFKITHYDGQEVNEPEFFSNTAFRIAPAERYEVEIEMTHPGAWAIEVYAEVNRSNLSALVPIYYEGYEDEKLISESYVNFFDMTNYGKFKDIGLPTTYTKEYSMILGTNDGGETFTINNKQYPEHEMFEVEEGDVVKFTIRNDTKVDHPMHLHGEFFYVISKDGEPIKGSPIKKDTLNVRPNETYEIVFDAKNPGIWMFHCHEFHHANGGMVAAIQYKGYTPNFEVDPSIPNQPE